MRENIVPAQHYPSPLRNKTYIEQTMMKMTSEVDNNFIPLLGVRTNKCPHGKVRHRESEKPKHFGDRNTQHNLYGKYGYEHQTVQGNQYTQYV
jgi:hypothetical protein